MGGDHRPANVELRRRRSEGGLVAIARGVQHHQEVTGADLDPSEFDIDHRGAAEGLDRRHPTEQLLHCHRQQRRIVGQVGTLVGLVVQHFHTSGEERAGGLVAGHQQGHAEAHDLEPAEGSALELGGLEDIEQIIAVGGGRVDVGHQELHHLADFGGGLRCVGSVGGGDDGIGPPAEDVPIGVTHPEQLGDHRNGDNGGEGIHPVHGLVRFHRVQDLGDRAANGGLEAAHRLGGELAVHHLPVEGVDRGVEMEDREGAESPRTTRPHGVVDQHASSRHEAVRVAADRADVVVTGHRPAAIECAVDGGLVTKIGQDIEVVGPEIEAGLGQIELKVGHIGH